MKALHLWLAMCLLPSLAAAGIVWRGDFETGDRSQFSTAQMVNADRLQLVTSPVAEGKYALKATVKQGDDPINSSGNRNELVYLGREKVGSEYWYRWRVMFANDFPNVDAGTGMGGTVDAGTGGALPDTAVKPSPLDEQGDELYRGGCSASGGSLAAFSLLGLLGLVGSRRRRRS